MRLFFPALLCLISQLVFSQENAAINFSPRDGLPSSQVYDIIQDDYGYLWFSTDKGLSRYDGYNFENYDKRDGLAGNVVFDFHKRPNGDIWCTTNSFGLFKISGQNPVFTPYKYNDSVVKYMEGKIINSVCFLGDDLLVCASNYLGFLTIEKDGKVSTVPSGAPFRDSSISYNLIEDASNEPFFFLDSAGIFTQGLKSNKTYKLSSKSGFIAKWEAMDFRGGQIYVLGNQVFWVSDGFDKHEIKKEYAISTGLLDNKHCWIGYRYGGVEIYNFNGERVTHFLEGKSVTQIFKDHEGNLWISTLEQGVFMIPNKAPNSIKEVEGMKITALEKSPTQDLFIGCDNGSIYRRTPNGVTNEFYLSERKKRAVKMKYIDDKLIFASDGIRYWSSLQKNRFKKIQSDYTSYYIVDYKSKLLYGKGSTILNNIDYNSREIIFDKMWIRDIKVFNNRIYGVNNNGLYVSDYPHKFTSQQIIGDMRINDLNVCKDQLVLGTGGNGVILLDGQYNTKYHITKEDGINSNFISATYTENDSIIWTCTNHGVNRIVFHRDGKYSITGLSTSDGLLSNEVWDLIVQNDTVWIGTQRGVNYMAIEDIYDHTTQPVNYYLNWNKITANGEGIVESRSLAYDENQLEFDFIGLSFIKSDKLVYRYRLIGLSNEWKYTTNRNITFSALAPGSYELVVQVKGKNKRWSSNQITSAFVIRPAYWSTWWFFCLVLVVVAVLIYGFFKVRILTYNKDIVREILIYVLRKIRRDQPCITIKHNGKEVRIDTNEIYFIKTDGNYLEIYTASDKFVIRSSISKFFDLLPDKLEFIQVHRSYIVRIEHIEQKSKKELVVLNQIIPIGRKYFEQTELITKS